MKAIRNARQVGDLQTVPRPVRHIDIVLWLFVPHPPKIPQLTVVKARTIISYSNIVLLKTNISFAQNGY